MKKILLFIVGLVLVVGIGVGAFFLLRPNNDKKASAVMTLETNPEIQLILDENNNVMSVNALNEDGESLMLSVNFIGISAEDAASLFAEQASKFVTNKEITLNSNSTFLHELNGELNVNITIACEDATSEKYNNLKESVKNSVNEYYKNAKIMAGAVVNVTEDIKSEIEKLGYDVSNYANKTYNEIIRDIETKSEELKNVAYSKRDEIFTKLSQLKNEFSNMFDLEESINEQKALIQVEENKITDYKNQLQTANEIDKITINALITTAENLLQQYKNALNTFETQYNELKADFDAEINEFIKQMKNQSETLINSLKANANSIMEQGKTLVNNFSTEMQLKGEGLITSIENYQNSLN